jgi:hypothetical protein
LITLLKVYDWGGGRRRKFGFCVKSAAFYTNLSPLYLVQVFVNVFLQQFLKLFIQIYLSFFGATSLVVGQSIETFDQELPNSYVITS